MVCGHIHQRKLTMIDDIIYASDGDWVESYSALVEHLDGKLKLMTAAVAEIQTPNQHAAKPIN